MASTISQLHCMMRIYSFQVNRTFLFLFPVLPVSFLCHWSSTELLHHMHTHTLTHTNCFEWIWTEITWRKKMLKIVRKTHKNSTDVRFAQVTWKSKYWLFYLRMVCCNIISPLITYQKKKKNLGSKRMKFRQFYWYILTFRYSIYRVLNMHRR